MKHKNLKALFLSITMMVSSVGLSEVILKADKSWDGGNINYPEGDTEITAVILTIKEGKEPPFHCHPVPTMGYVLKGTVEVETESGSKIQFEKGSAVVEVMNTVHRGRAIGGDAKIIVFYAGSKSYENTLLPEHKDFNKHCKTTDLSFKE